MKQEDIRWLQRFANYEKALRQLKEAVLLSEERNLSSLEKEGLVQRFEYTHELAWNLMKDFLRWQGITNIVGSRDATREAFNNELIRDGEMWMEMIKSRNLASHTYDEDVFNRLTPQIIDDFFPCLKNFLEHMRARL